MFNTLNKNNVLLLLSTFIIYMWVSIINVFFYSFITISLYKLICYDNNSLINLIDSISYEKACNIFYNVNTIIDISILNSSILKYNILLNDICSFNINNISNVLVNRHVETLLFCFDKIVVVISDTKCNLLFLNFYIRASNLNWINSISLQKTIILNVNESGLFFFRIYNPSHLHIKLITLYMIYPNIITLYVNKIQCFCFNIIFLYPLELVDLPVLIYINPFFSEFSSINYVNNIIIYYVIFLN